MKQRTWKQVGQAIGLMILSPVCAEYLSAYDKQTGDLGALLFGLLFLIPLYGFPAIMIRELSRRNKLGWPGIVSLSAAFGILQAGVIDQSLFSEGYRELESWDLMTSSTLIPPIGISIYTVVTFVGGHVIFSFCAPIALVEAFQPRHLKQRWLGLVGFFVCVSMFLLAATLVHMDHLATESSHASTSQVASALLVVAILVATPFVMARFPETRKHSAVSWSVLFPILIGVAGGSTLDLVPPSWLGSIVAAAVLTSILILLARIGWNCRDVTAVASGFLLSRSLWAFTYFPLFGEVSSISKYAHNTILLCMISTLSYMALKRASADLRELLELQHQ